MKSLPPPLAAPSRAPSQRPPCSPTISVVVPATNRPATLERCVRAIRRAEGGPVELIVVDRPATVGAVRARNLGARRATGQVILFVDADIELAPDALARIRATFACEPALDALFGSYDAWPAAPGVVSRFRNLLHHHVHHSCAGAATTFWTGIGAVRRTSFLAVGGFDERRFEGPSIEDVELGGRLVAAGAQISLDPRIQGTHLKAWSLAEMVWTDFARRGVPWVGLRLREGRASRALNLGWRHRLSALATTLGAASLSVALVAQTIAAMLAMAALIALLALNHSLYALLVRQQGIAGAVAGIGLHVVHHLTAVASVPAGLVLYALERARRSRAPGVEAAVVGVEGSQ